MSPEAAEALRSHLTEAPPLRLLPSLPGLEARRQGAKIRLKGKLAAGIIKRFGITSAAHLADFLCLHKSYVPKVFTQADGVSAKWALAAALVMPDIEPKYFAVMVADRERPTFTEGLKRLTDKEITQEDIVKFIDEEANKREEGNSNPYKIAAEASFDKDFKGSNGPAWNRERVKRLGLLQKRTGLNLEEIAEKAGVTHSFLLKVLSGDENLKKENLLRLWEALDRPKPSSLIFLTGSRRVKDYERLFSKRFGIRLNTKHLQQLVAEAQKEATEAATPFDWEGAMKQVSELEINRVSSTSTLSQVKIYAVTKRARLALANRVARENECCTSEQTAIKMGVSVSPLNQLLQGSLSYSLEAALRFAENNPDFSAEEVAVFAWPAVRPLLLAKLEERGYEATDMEEVSRVERALSREVPNCSLDNLHKIHQSNRQQTKQELDDSFIIIRGLFITSIFDLPECKTKEDAARILGVSDSNLAGLTVGRYFSSPSRTVDTFERADNPNYAAALSFCAPNQKPSVRKYLKERLGVTVSIDEEQQMVSEAQEIFESIGEDIEVFKQFMTWYNTASRVTKGKLTSRTLQLRKEGIIDAMRRHGYTERQQLADAWGVDLQVLGRVTTGKNSFTLGQVFRIMRVEESITPEYFHYFLDADMQPLFPAVSEHVTDTPISNQEVRRLQNKPLPYKDVTLRKAIKEIQSQGANAVIRTETDGEALVAAVRDYIMNLCLTDDLRTLGKVWDIDHYALEAELGKRKGMTVKNAIQAFEKTSVVEPEYFYFMTRPEDRPLFIAWLFEKGTELDHTKLADIKARLLK